MSVMKNPHTAVVVRHYFGGNKLGTSADAVAASDCDSLELYRFDPASRKLFESLTGGYL
jgi:hypothetical protein